MTRQETRERVKLLIQLADNLMEKGHAHAAQIKQWVATVDMAYKDFSHRMDIYRYDDGLEMFNGHSRQMARVVAVHFVPNYRDNLISI